MARAFASLYGDDPTVIVFASGVSNSAEHAAEAFNRERRLLESLLATDVSRLVYFGSCASSPLARTPYLRHKYEMESMVASTQVGLVLRLPQVVGRTANPTTLTNFLHDRISSGTEFVLWSQAQRNLLDIDDLVPIAATMIEKATDGPAVTSIASRISHPMSELAMMFERVLGCGANYTALPRGEPLEIDAPLCWSIAETLGIDLGPGYAESVIRKYYGRDT